MRLLLAILSLLLALPSSLGATINAVSTSYADVAAAVALAAEGDTVQLPAGSSSWTSQLVVPRIWLKGAGTNQTVITMNWALGNSSSFNIHCQSPGAEIPLILSDMTLVQGPSNGSTYALVGVGFITTSNVCNIFNMGFSNLTSAGIKPQGWTAGSVIHHSYFNVVLGYPATGIYVSGLAKNDLVNAWTKPTLWGTTNSGIYVEDCIFDWPQNANGSVDSDYGAAWVFRHNLSTNVNVGNHGLDSTGVDSTRNWEVYNNHFVSTGPSSVNTFFSVRGGTGLFASNTVAGPAGDIVSLQNYRNSGTNLYGGTVPCCNPWGPVGSTNVYDGPGPYPTRYPPYQQIGQSSPITNYPSGGPGGIAYRQGPTVPVYIWENWHGGVAITGIVGNVYVNTGPYAYIPTATLSIIEGRDFTNGVAMPGWTPAPYPFPYPMMPFTNTPPSTSSLPVVVQGKVQLRGMVNLRIQ